MVHVGGAPESKKRSKKEGARDLDTAFSDFPQEVQLSYSELPESVKLMLKQREAEVTASVSTGSGIERL